MFVVTIFERRSGIATFSVLVLGDRFYRSQSEQRWLRNTSGEHVEVVKENGLLKVPWEQTIFKNRIQYALWSAYFLEG